MKPIMVYYRSILDWVGCRSDLFLEIHWPDNPQSSGQWVTQTTTKSLSSGKTEHYSFFLLN
jgi:hypothetical protein